MSLHRFVRHGLMTVRPSATLREAADVMKRRHAGDVVVVDDDGGESRVVGILTDRDLALLAADEMPLATTIVADVMTRDLLTAKPADDVFVLVTRMRQRGVRRVPLVDEHGAPVGIVTADDLYELLSEALAALAGISDRQIAREADSLTTLAPLV